MNIEALRAGRNITAKLRVTSFHRGQLGGGVLIGTDEQGVSRRATIGRQFLPRLPFKGEIWRVVGTEAFSREHASTYLDVSMALPMPLEGEAVVRYLADNPKFPGLGYKTALRLRNALGVRGLYQALQQRDHRTIANAVGPKMAAVIIDAVGLLGDEVKSLQELEHLGVDGATAGLAFSVWGSAAAKFLLAQPYALRLLLPWGEVDARALRLGLMPDDERRTSAIVEEALAQAYRRGHTGTTYSQLCASVQELGRTTSPIQTVTCVQRAIDAGRCFKHASGLLQSRGVHWMEREVERVLLERATAPPTADSGAALAGVSAAETELGKPLTALQREAVEMAVKARVAAVAGGAGTGKTTTVHAIVRARIAAKAFEEDPSGARDQIVQCAVAGRAARRIAQATGLPAVTIARLIRDLQADRCDLSGSLLVLDEASMLDLPTAYQLLTKLPIDCDLLFVGDPGQLPAIGPGRVYSAMLSGDRIPRVVLDLPQRQSGASGIPDVAQAIREGRLPDLQAFDPKRPDREGVFILPTASSADTIAAASLDTFASLAGPVPARGRYQSVLDRDVQVLSATKNGASGTKALSREIEDRYTSRQERAAGWGLAVGSKVLWLKNDYDKAPIRDSDGRIKIDPTTGRQEGFGLMNGCLGVVRRHSDGRDTDTGAPGSWVEFEDGASDWIYESDLQNLTHGWAVTVHKAQGSAFQRVIVPLAVSRLVDRAMIYTAVTRAVRTCVLVGEPESIRAAVKAPPRVQLRQTCLSL